MTLSIDLFCRVVDNFGDIGVCWRLARQLTRDQQCHVRLYVDAMDVFEKIEPRITPAAPHQTIDGVDIIRWGQDTFTPPDPVGDGVIEAFACDLPPDMIAAMRTAPTPPVWIDLEYLTAEDWVDDAHAIPSIHPMTGLTKTLFFPGFTPHTGGLSREADLQARRDAFQTDPAAQNAWRTAHTIPARHAGVLDISLFCYETAPVAALFTPAQSWAAQTGTKIRFFVPDGVAKTAMQSWPNTQQMNESISIHPIPFLPQNDYDKLLWTCDVNFVRGEDSFVRAIWAARPMIWHIYPQDDDAHLAKLNAFLTRYRADLSPAIRDRLAQFTAMWNVGKTENTAHIIHEFLSALPHLHPHAQRWACGLTAQADLASQITDFIKTQKQTQNQRTNIE